MSGEGASGQPAATSISRSLRANPLFTVALAASGGVLLADTWPASVLFSLAALLLGLASWRRRQGVVGLLLLGGAIATAFAATHAWHQQTFRSFPHFAALATAPQGLRVAGTGRVLQAPQPAGFKHRQAPIQLREITIGGTAYRLRHRLLARVSGHTLRYGDVLGFTGRLHLPELPRNPGQFDYRGYLHRQGYVGVVEITETERWATTDRQPNPLKALAFRARERMAAAITRDLHGENEIAAILSAMVLGMRHETTPEMELPFRYSGSLHLFAVSGLHVGIFALIAWLLLKPWGLGRAHVTLLLIPLLFFYAFITGWRPSAVRAAVMAAIFLGGYCVHREPRLLNSLGLAALLILASDSNQLFRPGFQLSFTVLLAIIVLTRPLQRPLRRWLHPDPLIPRSLLDEHEQRAYAYRRWLGNLATVSLAAWLGSLPLMAFSFHLVTPIALIANCFLMPFAFFILLTASLSMLASLIGFLGWANILFNNANFALVNSLVAVAELFSSAPGGHFYVSGQAPFTHPPLAITVLDMPRGGACTHIAMRGGPSELLDTGHAQAFPRLTAPYLQHAGVNRLDRVWLTHGDTSHISAGPEILARYQPRVYAPLWESRSPSMQRIETLLAGRESALIRVHAGTAVRLSTGAYWEILYPPENEAFAPALADDRGLVLRLHYGPWRFLFMADAGLHTERWLVDSGQDLGADVLIKGQHAEDASGLASLLQRVRPRVIVWDSETAQPQRAPELQAWAASGTCRVFDQASAGAILLHVSRRALTVRGFRAADQEITLKRAR